MNIQGVARIKRKNSGLDDVILTKDYQHKSVYIAI